MESDRAQLNRIIAARTAELEQANARLSGIDRARRRFFADVGHELRTPLTVILAEAELGLQNPAVQNDARESMSVIHARARRLNRRIDDLLRVARSETGEIQLNPGPFDLAEAAAQAASDIGPLARRRDVRLEIELTPCPAIGDADWIRQVISGLIENAVKHAGAGSTVVVRTAQRDGQAMALVTDNGPGLPDDAIPVVLERFAQGSREASGSGFGVGLSLARWVVERQSGSLMLASPALDAPAGGAQAGPGLTVTVTLPAGDGQ